jgi:hypothetical protein
VDTSRPTRLQERRPHNNGDVCSRRTCSRNNIQGRRWGDRLLRNCRDLNVDFLSFPFLSFPVAQEPKSGLGRLLLEVSRSHSDTPHSVGLLWTSDQSVAETSTRQHRNTHKGQTYRHHAGFEPTVPVSARPKANALDRAATGIGIRWFHSTRNVVTARYCSVLLQKRLSTQQHNFLATNVDPAIGQYPTTHSSGSLDVTDDTDHGLYYHTFRIPHLAATHGHVSSLLKGPVERQ